MLHLPSRFLSGWPIYPLANFRHLLIRSTAGKFSFDHISFRL